MEFLGHIVSPEGVSTDPKKIDKVANWPVPTYKPDIQQFLGLANYYRRFIKDFARIATRQSNSAGARVHGRPQHIILFFSFPLFYSLIPKMIPYCSCNNNNILFLKFSQTRTIKIGTQYATIEVNAYYIEPSVWQRLSLVESSVVAHQTHPLGT